MSANTKCTYSIQFKPLVQFKRMQFANNEAEFIKWTEEKFTNPRVARILANDGESAFNTRLDMITSALNEAPEKIDSIKIYYANNSVAYGKCINSFKQNVVESVLFNKSAPANEKWIDANAIDKESGLTNVNKKLTDYKLSLINQIRNFFGKGNLAFNYNDASADQILSLAISDIITRVEQHPKDLSEEFATIYQSYVILKNFNKLIEEKFPVVKIKPEYQNTTLHGINMYLYEGPNVKHRVSWTTNEHISAQSQYSDLAQILLDYFPEVYYGSDSIERTIGQSGFIAVMNRFKTALFYTDMLKKHRKAYYYDLVNPNSKPHFNIREALSDYLYELREQTGKWRSVPESISTQLGKLEGIIKYLFNEDSVPADIVSMFYGMFDKTVPLSYVEYAYKNGKFKANLLKDKFVQQQQTELQRLINGRVHTFRNNPSLFERFKSEYGITVKSDSITIKLDESNSISLVPNIDASGHFKVSITGNNDIEMTASVSNFIVSLLGTYLPLDENYDTVSKQLNRHNGHECAVLNDFADIIAMTLLGSSDVEFSPLDKVRNTLKFNNNFLYSLLERAASTLSIVYGNESRNVVDNIRGDKIPTNGLTSLVHNAYKIAAEMANYNDSDDPMAISSNAYVPIAVNSILAPKKDSDYIPGFGAPIVRSGVNINGKIKDVTALTLPELLEIAITYDYYDNLNSKDKTIYIQHANDADKSRHWVIPFLMRTVPASTQTWDEKRGRWISGAALEYDMATLLQDLAKGESEGNPIYEILRGLRQSRYNAVASNVLKDYNTVFKTNHKTLKELDDWLIQQNMSVDEIRAFFRMDKNYLLSLVLSDNSRKYSENDIDAFFEGRTGKINFKDEIHASAINKVGRVNETLFAYQETFNDPAKFERRLAKSRAYFAKDMFDSRLKLNKNTNRVIGDKWNSISDDWKEIIKNGTDLVQTGNLILFKVYDKSGRLINVNAGNDSALIDSSNRVVLNPILESYMMADILYSNEFNMLLTGDVFGHPIKKKNGSTKDNGWGSSDFYDYCEASRLVAANKRAVIYGSSIHPFQHNLPNNRGVAKSIKCAVISDPKANVYALFGGIDGEKIDDDVDVFDGSGLQSIYEALLEQESLIDAAAGLDEKTILGYNDKYFGTQKLLKWAVYAITNERRRMSMESDISLERLFRKMHSQQFDIKLPMYELFNRCGYSDNLYVRSRDTRKYYKITGVVQKQNSRGETVYARTAIEVTKNGSPIDENHVVYLNNRNIKVEDNPLNFDQGFTYNTIYDLDQFFGGAYEMALDGDELKYSSRGNHTVLDIICDNNLKEHFISYVVNKSAIKVGAENVNSEKRYYDDEELDTMEMSTEYGGLQMNAEHAIDDSHVKEMTQMISALIEKGWSFDLVNDIYNDIGYVVEQALSKFKVRLQGAETDPAALRRVFGKALIEAYAKGDRDTLGLAQAFLANAEKLLREGDLNFKFPFSAATVHGSFISTVASLFTKSAIRRKYAGIAAVLTPSYDMITVYNGNKMAEAYFDELVAYKEAHPEYSEWTLQELTHRIEKDGVFNPFIEWTEDFTFEDTIVYQDELGNWQSKTITGYEDYWNYKHNRPTNFGVLKSHPRNLRGAITSFSVNGRNYNTYDFGTTHAANLTVKKRLTNSDKEEIIRVLAWARNAFTEFDRLFVANDLERTLTASNIDTVLDTGDYTLLSDLIDVRKTLYNIIQRQMKYLSESNLVIDIEFGQESTENVHTDGAEIVLGKMWAEQFLLRENDDLQSILDQGEYFFRNRLRDKYQLPSSSLDDKYDVVAWTKEGKRILIKIDDTLNYNFEKSINRDVTIIDGIAYLDGNELCNASNKAFYKITDNNSQHDVVVVGSSEELNAFLEDANISLYKVNSGSNNLIGLVEPDEDGTYTYVAPDGAMEVLSEENFNELDDTTKQYVLSSVMQFRESKGEDRDWKNRLNKQAANMFKSFKLSINAIGARIPSQGMQSFQPMRIVGFSDSLTNDVYVNRHNTYLEGSDYDIDKTYILTYNVNSDGTIETTSRLASFLGPDAALELNLPKNRDFEEATDGEEHQVITEDQLYLLLDRRDNVALWNSVLSGNERIRFERTNHYYNEDRIFEQKKSQLLRLLNLHEKTRITENGLKNRVVHAIRKVILDPKNQLNLYNPIAMTEQRAAVKPELVKDDNHMNIDIPSAKYKAQVDNMTGKDCVGITAVSIKSYFAKSAYTNEILKELPNVSDEDIIKILSSLCFEHPRTKRMTLLANVNVGDVIDRLIKDDREVLRVNATGVLSNFNGPNGFKLVECLKLIERISNRVDCAAQLSGLLSAATDNAKELILKKINATSRLIDVFTVALQMGMKFNEIADIMTSPLFNSIVRLADNNIFKKEGSYNIKTAIDFYLSDNILPLRTGDKLRLMELLKKVIPAETFANGNIDDSSLSKLLGDNNIVNKILFDVCNKIKNYGKVNYNEFGDEETSENSYAQPKLEDWVKIQNFLEECLDRNTVIAELRKSPTYNKQVENIRLVRTKFIPATEEQQILGTMLRINQEVPNSEFAQYSYVHQIESFITERLQLAEKFNLMRFLSDPEYAKIMTDSYEQEDKKSTVNILDLIQRVPHFAEMFKSLYDVNKTLTTLSSRYDFTQQIAEEISGNSKYGLSEREFRQVGYYVNDLMLISFLTSKGLSFTLAEGLKQYKYGKATPEETTRSEPVKIESLYDLATFKNWMENYVIPALKERYGDDNFFIHTLSKVAEEDINTHETRSYYKMPLNMLALDTTIKHKLTYERCLRAFNAIANDTFGGWKIVDLFFVYNAIVNKDAISRTSMTRLFEDMVGNENNSSLIKDYYEFVSDTDSNPELREQVRKSLREKDARAYIERNVRNTFITSEDAPGLSKYGEDFTFKMASLLGGWKLNKPQVTPYVQEAKTYEYKMDGLSTISSIAQSFNERFGQGQQIIEIHTKNWFMDERNVKALDGDYSNEAAFIHTTVDEDGQAHTKIYVNADKANAFKLIHEFAHVIFAQLKYNAINGNDDSQLYFKVMSIVRSHPKYDEYAREYEGRSFVGTDLDEEVFVNLLEHFLDNRLSGWVTSDNIFQTNTWPIIEALNEIFKIGMPKNVDLMKVGASDLNSILRLFGSRLLDTDSFDISETALNWRMKTKWAKDQLLKSWDETKKIGLEYKCD